MTLQCANCYRNSCHEVGLGIGITREQSVSNKNSQRTKMNQWSRKTTVEPGNGCGLSLSKAIWHNPAMSLIYTWIAVCVEEI